MFTKAMAPLISRVLHRLVLLEVDHTNLFKEQHSDAYATLHTAPAPGRRIVPERSAPALEIRALAEGGHSMAARSAGILCTYLYFKADRSLLQCGIS